jgi:DNA-directed RNA polymerase specialized sigma24 family protein
MNAARCAALQESMERRADGDRAAFHDVFVVAWPLLRAFCRTAVPSPEAEDAAQQALLKAFERASVFERGREVMPWLFGIAANECRTIRRQGMRRREVSLEGAPVCAGGGASPEEQVIARDLEDAVRETLKDLPARDIETILESLRHERMGSTATFRKRLERARKRLRAAWSARYGIL